MLEGKRVKHIKAYDVSDTLGQWGVISSHDRNKALVEFEDAVYRLPLHCLSESDVPVQRLREGDYVRYIGGSRWFDAHWVGTIFYYDGRFQYYGNMGDYQCFYEKVELKKGSMFKIANTREANPVPDKVLDHKVHRVSKIHGTKIWFEYKKEEYTINTWNITLIEDEEPRVNDTVYYNNRYLGVTEAKDGLLKLKNGAKALVEEVELYRRRPKDHDVKNKQVVYNSGEFGNSLAHPLQEIFTSVRVHRGYCEPIVSCDNKYGHPCYLTLEDIEIIKLEGEYIFTYTDEQRNLIGQFDPEISRNFELENYSLFRNKETGVDFAVKYKKSDSNFHQAKRESRRIGDTPGGRGIYARIAKINKSKGFTISGTMFKASQEALKMFDKTFVEEGDFVRESIEVEDAVVYVYEVKRKTLNEFKQKTKIING